MDKQKTPDIDRMMALDWLVGHFEFWPTVIPRDPNHAPRGWEWLSVPNNSVPPITYEYVVVESSRIMGGKQITRDDWFNHVSPKGSEREKAIQWITANLTHWPVNELSCSLDGWGWSTIHSSHGLLAEIIFTNDTDEITISEDDVPAYKAPDFDEYKPPTTDGLDGMMSRVLDPAPIMKFFKYEHLPEHLQNTSALVFNLATALYNGLPDNAEKAAGLRKLLEAKDCFVRASL